MNTEPKAIPNRKLIKCDVCRKQIADLKDIFAFEGVISKKDWVDYTLCGQCSKHLRKYLIRLRKLV